MTIEEAVLDRLKQLPPDKQLEVLDFAEFLRQKGTGAPKRPLKSLEGALAHLGVHITEEDIAEARREMWGNFPREFPSDPNS